MKQYSVLIMVVLLLSVQSAGAQRYKEKDGNYSNTPTDMLPYGKYQDAYIYHFQEPQAFTGAGREKNPSPLA